MEENHYYPFGLTMAGLSDKGIKTNYSENRYRYNEKELQNKEFADGTGLEEYDFGARLHDPQLGIWHNIDQSADNHFNMSPYALLGDNPIRYLDLDGNDWVDANGNLIYSDRGFTKFASLNDIRLGNALMITKTGKAQFKKLIETGVKIKIQFNNTDLFKDADNRVKLGNTAHTRVIDLNTVKEATITIYIEAITYFMTDKSVTDHTIGSVDIANSGFSFIDILAAVAGHEIEHTTDENYRASKKRKDFEGPAFGISDLILNEEKENNKKKSTNSVFKDFEDIYSYKQNNSSSSSADSEEDPSNMGGEEFHKFIPGQQ